jgi:PAS domain S-box-containing protein
LILRLAPLVPPDAPVEPGHVVHLPESGDAPPVPPARSGVVTPTDAPPDAASDTRVLTNGTERLSNSSSLRGWSAAVAGAHDACFVLDADGVVVSVSVAGVDLLGSGDMAIMGRHLLDVIDLVDLESGASDPEYAPRITPLVVLRSPGLARSLMRLRHHDGAVVTLDTSSAPIHDVTGQVIGSVTFVSPIRMR